MLTGRLTLLAAIGSMLMLVMPIGPLASLLVVNGVLLVAFVLDVVLAPNPSKISVERTMPPVVPLHTSVNVEWSVASRHSRPTRVVIDDGLMPSLRAGSRRVRATVPAGGRIIAETLITPQRRGRFEVTRIVVRTFGPLHLGGRQGRRDVSSELRVYPSFKSRREAELRIEKARILEVGLRSVRGHGGGTEFEQLREYSIDDDFRRIDWAATARAAKPIVRTYRAERNQNVVCLLDCGRLMAGRVDDVPRLEHAMDALMAVTTVASRLGDRVGLIAFDSAVRAEVPAGQGSRQLAPITEAIYQLQPQLQESDYSNAFMRMLSRFKRRSLVIVFTELNEHSTAEALRPALSLLLKRHFVIVASVTDPDVALWGRSVPSEANKTFRKAAAISALSKRRATAASLRGFGVTVVDAVPGKLAAQLADTYLNVKATGAL